MKTKILFIIPDFAHGGTNKTLESYLSLIDSAKYDVFIFCYTNARRHGYYYQIFAPYLVPAFWWNSILKVNPFTRKLYRLLLKFAPSLAEKCDRHEVKYLQNKHSFDVIIGFQEGETTKYASYFKANCKIAWVHSFFSDLAVKEGQMEYQSIYESFDKIVCVSDGVQTYFNQRLQGLKSHSLRIYNPLDAEKIKNKAKEQIEDKRYLVDTFKLLSVGRLDDVKNFHLIPKIIFELKRRGISAFKWYLMGAAFNEAYKQLLLKKIEEYHVEKELVLLGQKDNPYPYILRADLMVCPSKSEGYPYVLNEAKVLHTPIVANSFKSAYEVVDDNCGFVVDLEQMPNLLQELITDKNHIYGNIKEKIAHCQYNNMAIVEQLYSLFAKP